MQGRTFRFREIEMTEVVTADEAKTYCAIQMRHPPNLGPALHVHPEAAETFYIMSGTYTFWRGDECLQAGAGDAVCIPAGVPHRYRSGPEGGTALVISPPMLADYFSGIAARLAAGEHVSLDDEAAFGRRHGQVFLSLDGHWT